MRWDGRLLFSFLGPVLCLYLCLSRFKLGDGVRVLFGRFFKDVDIDIDIDIDIAGSFLTPAQPPMASVTYLVRGGTVVDVDARV